MTKPSSTFEQQSGHTLMVTGASVGIGLLLNVVVSRSLGPSGKGILDLVGATSGLFVLVLGLSINASLTQLVAKRGGLPAGLTAQLAIWAGTAGLLTGAFFYFLPTFSTRIGLLPEHDRVFWSTFVSLTVIAGVYATGLRGLLIGQNFLIGVNRIDFILKTGLLVSYVTIAFTVHPATAKIFSLAGISAALLLPVALLPMLRGNSLSAKGTWGTLITMTLPIHGTNILHFINQRADIFFIQAFHGSVEVALYALAVSLAQCILLLSSALAQPLLPKVAAASTSVEAAFHAINTCRLFCALAAGAVVLLLVAGVWLVPIVFGKDFSGSLPSLLVLLPGMISFGVTNIMISYFVGINCGGINLVISLVALVFTVGGNLLLTRYYGAIGAAATSTAAYGIAGALSLGLFSRRTRLPFYYAIIPPLTTWQSIPRLIKLFRP